MSNVYVTKGDNFIGGMHRPFRLDCGIHSGKDKQNPPVSVFLTDDEMKDLVRQVNALMPPVPDNLTITQEETNSDDGFPPEYVQTKTATTQSAESRLGAVEVYCSDAALSIALNSFDIDKLVGRVAALEMKIALKGPIG